MAVRHGRYKMHLWTWTTPTQELEKVKIVKRITIITYPTIAASAVIVIYLVFL